MPNKYKRALFRLSLFVLTSFSLITAFAIYLDLHLYLKPVPKDFEQAIQQQLQAAKFPSAFNCDFSK